jgi:amidase
LFGLSAALRFCNRWCPPQINPPVIIIKTILLLISSVAIAVSIRAQGTTDVPTQHNEKTVAQLQHEMAAGKLTSVELTKYYIARIIALDQSGTDNGVNSIIELNPDALAMAQNADKLRKQGTVLGPLHGIPVLLKDNIDTGDKMQTSAGSFALVGKPAQGIRR